MTWTCLAVVGLLNHSPFLQESLQYHFSIDKQNMCSRFFFVKFIFCNRVLKAMQPSTSSVESAKYGKVPRSVGVAKNVSSEHFIEHNKKR